MTVPATSAQRHGPPSHVEVLRATSRGMQDLVDAAVGRPTFVTHGERPLDECSAYLFVFLTPAGLAHAGVPPSDAGACAALTEISEGYTLLRTNKVRCRGRPWRRRARPAHADALQQWVRARADTPWNLIGAQACAIYLLGI